MSGFENHLVKGWEYHAVHVRTVGHRRRATDGVAHKINSEPDEDIHAVLYCCNQRLVALGDGVKTEYLAMGWTQTDWDRDEHGVLGSGPC